MIIVIIAEPVVVVIQLITLRIWSIIFDAVSLTRCHQRSQLELLLERIAAVAAVLMPLVGEQLFRVGAAAVEQRFRLFLGSRRSGSGTLPIFGILARIILCYGLLHRLGVLLFSHSMYALAPVPVDMDQG